MRPSIPTFSPSRRQSGIFSSIYRRWFKRSANGSVNLLGPAGMAVLFPCVVIVLILFLFYQNSQSPSIPARPAGLPSPNRPISEKYDQVFAKGCLEPAVESPRANAAIVMLTRNEDLEGVVSSLRSFERHFNRWFHYPYVFLNDREFNSTFKSEVEKHVSAPVKFGKVGPELWEFPEWADRSVVKEGIARQGDLGIMYGGLESYHHMCRFYSGQFYKHEILLEYDWYWRLEPDVKFFCDITYDPFVYMDSHNKTYGWTIAIKELRETVPNLFRYASAHKRREKLGTKGMWEMFTHDVGLGQSELGNLPQQKTHSVPISEKARLLGNPSLLNTDPEEMEGEKYNMCHFWSNFEIARLDWYRSKEYNDFFEALDQSGGFWMERWGDAPVHSLAVGALLSPSQIHYFRDIGYRHSTIQHCPANAVGRQLPHVPYTEPALLLDPGLSPRLEKDIREEEKRWREADPERDNGVGCRCRCDTDAIDVEIKEGTCFPEWVEVMGGWAGL